jgi:thymidylate synthase
MARPTLPNDGTSERQYLNLLDAITRFGDDKMDRTGTGTRGLHGETMRYDLSDGTIPLLTTKRVFFKGVAQELLWLLSGDTNIRTLVLQGVHIWSEWPHKAYVQATGEALSLEDFEARIAADEEFARQWGDLGPVYGKQWRRWQGPDGQEYDQIADLIEQIRTNPGSRRLIFTGWNVADIAKMALPPCHLLYQFYVMDGRLSCTLYQRSCDVGLGVPFNIASVALLVHLLAEQCDLKPGELFWVGHDVHLYNNHIAPLQEQLTRTPRAFPTFKSKRRAKSLFDYRLSDFKVSGYAPDPNIPLEVAV